MLYFKPLKFLFKESMLVEDLFEKELRYTVTQKKKIVETYGEGFFIYSNEDFAGEFLSSDAYRVLQNHDRLEGLTEYCGAHKKERISYVLSVGLVKDFQKKGIGNFLRCYAQGYLKGLGYTKLCGHASSPAQIHIVQKFGGRVLTEYRNWGNSGRTALFYECDL